MAIKLVAAPRYQLYIYLLLLDKLFVAQEERAFKASICGVATPAVAKSLAEVDKRKTEAREQFKAPAAGCRRAPSSGQNFRDR
jgi:hypothetical protein